MHQVLRIPRPKRLGKTSPAAHQRHDAGASSESDRCWHRTTAKTGPWRIRLCTVSSQRMAGGKKWSAAWNTVANSQHVSFIERFRPFQSLIGKHLGPAVTDKVLHPIHDGIGFAINTSLTCQKPNNILQSPHG